VSTQGAGPIGDRGEKRSNAFESNHAAIIARTLRWADDAAERRDYAEALRWIATVESLGEALPRDYETRRRRWRQAISDRPS
jgi:hypothetical protein